MPRIQITLQIEELPRFGDNAPIPLDGKVTRQSMSPWLSILRDGVVVYLTDGFARITATLSPLIFGGRTLVARPHWGDYEELEVRPEHNPGRPVLDDEIVEGTEEWDAMERGLLDGPAGG